VLTKNGEVLKCPTLDILDSIKILEQVFKITTAHVFGIATIKSQDRGVGFNFKLKEPMKIDIGRLDTLFYLSLLFATNTLTAPFYNRLQSFDFEIGRDIF